MVSKILKVTLVICSFLCNVHFINSKCKVTQTMKKCCFLHFANLNKKVPTSFADSKGDFCLVSWSDLPLFAIFENGHISADEVYFYQFNSTVLILEKIEG